MNAARCLVVFFTVAQLLMLMPAVMAEDHGTWPQVVLNVTGQPPLNNRKMQGFMDEVAVEAFRRIGYRLKTVVLPAERGLLNANLGVIDGEMSRIAGLQKSYVNLVQVPEKIMDWEFVAFGKPGLNAGMGWRALQGSNVAIINGWKILERNVRTHARVMKVYDPDSLFAMLKRNRADYVIYERWAGYKYLKKYHLDQMELALPPLARKNMYIYLNKKHKNLVPALAASLRSMREDHTYQGIESRKLRLLE